MDITSLFKLSSGLFIISSTDSTKQNGCVINTVLQATANIPRIIAIVNKDNLTNKLIKKSGRFCVNVLDKSVSMDVISHFGFKSGKDCEKYDGTFKAMPDAHGVPYLIDFSCAMYSCRVINATDADTHDIFLAEVEDCFVTSENEPLTYEYYHKVLKGTAPKNAPTYIAPTGNGYKCSVCGYVHTDETLPADFVCPICKQPASVFEKI